MGTDLAKASFDFCLFCSSGSRFWKGCSSISTLAFKSILGNGVPPRGGNAKFVLLTHVISSNATAAELRSSSGANGNALPGNPDPRTFWNKPGLSRYFDGYKFVGIMPGSVYFAVPLDEKFSSSGGLSRIANSTIVLTPNGVEKRSDLNFWWVWAG